MTADSSGQASPSETSETSGTSESCETLLSEWSTALALAGLAPATRSAYERHVRDTLLTLSEGLGCALSGLTLAHCSRPRLRAALLSYRDRPDRRHADLTAAPTRRSPAALRLRLQALRSFTRWCVDEGLLTTDPAASLTLPPATPTPLARPSQQRACTPAELSRVLDAAASSRTPQRDLALAALLAGLGCSLGEVVALRLADLSDLTGITAAAPSLRVTGKPRTLATPAGLRSTSQLRLLTLPPTVATALRAYLPERERVLARWARADLAHPPLAHPELVLAGPHALTEAARTRVLAKACTRLLERAGVAHHNRASSLLRASFASRALDAGAPLPQVASLMGLRSLGALRQMVDLDVAHPPPLALDLPS